MADKLKASIRAAKHLDETAKFEMHEMLGRFEGELQAKDIAIAALKSECLKYIIYNIQRSDRSILSDPMFALGRDISDVSHNKLKEPVAVDLHVGQQGAMNHRLKVLQRLVDAQKSALKKLTECLREAECQKGNLMNEMEERNARHRKEMAEAASRAPASTSETTAQPSSGTEDKSADSGDLNQLRKDLLAEKEATINLQSEVDSLTKKLADERASKKQITLLLLDDRKKMTTLYLEEKKRSEDLSHLLREEKSKVHSLGIGLEEESKRSLAMEAELERYLLQVNSQRDELAGMRTLHKELEEALRRARGDADHFKKQLTEAHRVAMSQASVAASVAAAVVNNPAAFSESIAGDSLVLPNNAGNPGQCSAAYGLASSTTKYNVQPDMKGSTMTSAYERDTQQGKNVPKSRPTMNDYHASSGTIIPRQHKSGVLNSTTVDAGGCSPLQPVASAASNVSASSKMVNSSGDSASNAISSTVSLAASRLISLSAQASSSPSSSSSSSGSSAQQGLSSSGGLAKGGGSSKASGSSSAAMGKGMPPPVPPNKPAMSALYKPITAALKLGGGGGGGNDNGAAVVGSDVDKNN